MKTPITPAVCNTPLNWIILFHAPTDMDEWESFTGTRAEAEAYATSDDRHLNYNRTGFKLLPDIPALPPQGQSGMVVTVTNYPAGTGPEFATITLKNGMLIEVGPEGINLYAQPDHLGTTTQPVAGILFNA